MQTAFSHYKSIGNFLNAQGQLAPYFSDPIWPKFELVRDCMHVLVTFKFKNDRIKKQPRKGGDIVFIIISQWGISVAMETRVSIQPAP